MTRCPEVRVSHEYPVAPTIRNGRAVAVRFGCVRSNNGIGQTALPEISARITPTRFSLTRWSTSTGNRRGTCAGTTNARLFRATSFEHEYARSHLREHGNLQQEITQCDQYQESAARS